MPKRGRAHAEEEPESALSDLAGRLRPLAQGRAYNRCRLRFSEHGALSSIATELHQPVEDLSVFDSFSRGVQTEGLAQADYRLHNSRFLGFVQHLVGKRSVDLERVEF